jgi:predicted glycoside hydrolase/deacetylase ChbG (UPF0249 family)
VWSHPGTGLLIVNADDWGMSRTATDAARECFAARTISSATAMVWMADSERAAAIGVQERLPIGLHLNLIEPYTGPGVPAAVAARQREICGRMAGEHPAALLYDPRWRKRFDACIADQIERFRELYGREPTHVDGHRHMHLALNAILSAPLGGARGYRRPFSLAAGESSPARRAIRAGLAAAIRARFPTTDRLMSIRSLLPELGGSGAQGKLEAARSGSVEVMAHPELEDERAALRSEAWSALIEPLRVGSFADLSA